MSLYSLEEICKGCTHSVFVETPKGKEVFWDCKIDKENEANGYDCTCPHRIVFFSKKEGRMRTLNSGGGE